MTPLLPQISLEQSRRHLHLAFATPQRVLSSAVLGGGLREVSHLLNLKVPQQGAAGTDPATHLRRYCRARGWRGPLVGMMTAAAMDSLCLRRARCQGVELLVLVTAGLSNPRRAGDRADYRRLCSAPLAAGTINSVILTDAGLSPAALVEALMIATEAKAAALQQLGVVSPVSGLLATGTGTDATAVVSGQGPRVNYCGKHVLFGEILGRLVTEAVIGASTWPVATAE